MTDDHKDETSEPVDETAEGSEASSAGPVAEDDSSSSQAAGEEPTSTPPADEAPEDAAPEAVAEGESSEGSAGKSDEGSDAADETPAEEPVAEEAPAEEPEAVEETPAEEPVAEEAPDEPQAEKKKDVIPGADLEPIAVEPEKQLSAEEKARLEAEEEEKARREAALVGGDETEAASREPAKMESGSRFLATGKRKCSIARVILLPGDGKVEINKRSLDEFFPRPLHQTMAVQPLTVSGYEGNVDVRVRVHGGGISGQAGAVRHGIARALTEIDPELRGELKRRGFLTRDARVKERRKAGFKKARKKPQFSKR
jgi:small subunit ribosomal protein S9